MDLSGHMLLAQGAAPAAQQPNSLITMVPFLLAIGVMIFFMYRSQKKQAQQRQEMLSSIKIGDKLLTAGGIYGKVIKITEQSFKVEIADKVDIEVDKNGISRVIREEVADPKK